MADTDRRFESIEGLLTHRGRPARRQNVDSASPVVEVRSAGEGQALNEGQAAERVAARPTERTVDEVGPAAQLPKLRSRREPAAAAGSRQPSERTGGVGERGFVGQAEQRTDARSGSRGGTRRVAVRLPAQLHAALVDRVERDGSSQGHVVLDAIEQLFASGSLREVIARTLPPSGDGLFDRTRLRGRAEASVPAELRLRASALEQVDRLAAENGAESRTQLIVAALAAYLGAADASADRAAQRTDAAGDRALRRV